MPATFTLRQQFETQLAALVEKFNRQRAHYLSSAYNETDVRAEFIDPLFEALGWDVSNRAGAGPHDKEVIREKSEVSGRSDYQFQLNGRVMFIVEAKAPHVPLDRTDVILQAKKYAWNSKETSIAAITDFEEFRLYDATVKPDPKHPDVGLIFATKYTEYLKVETGNDLWLLSKEAVATGSIEQLLKMSSVKQRERLPVDVAFLDDLTAWREKLAKAVFKIEPEIDPADLNSVVQVFLDRLIFIRFAEDHGILAKRGLEDVARLWERSGKHRSIVNDLNALFHEVNDLLNGEIFKLHRCEKIDWDREAALVAKIIQALYDGPYRFDVIGVELLGSIYERYLGKTIRATATRVVVEDKPEVRKAGGVYYTPRYIVDYIVEQTVGKLIEGKTPAQIAKLKILDPACGSGSFLLGAYQKLIEYHERWYAGKKAPTPSLPRSQTAANRGGREDSPPAKRGELEGGGVAQLPLLDAGEGGEYRLPLAEKAAILKNNLCGVDIDPQAVEITMMSLYIKMLEGERGAIMGRGILPPLRDNIKCGNSLIGYDIREQLGITDEDTERIKPFDWHSQREGFGDIMKAGGFDAVIGNPPYGAELGGVQKAYLQEVFKGESKSYDSYELFLLAAARLLKANGRISMIIPASWLTGEKYEGSRHKLLTDLFPAVAYAMPFDVFKDAYIDTAVVVLTSRQIDDCLIHYFPKKERLSAIPDGIGVRVPIQSIREDPQNRLSMVLSRATAPILEKIKNSPASFGDWFDISRGVQPYSRSKHSETQISSRFLHANFKKSKDYMPELQGHELSRYYASPERTSFIKYSEEIASTRPLKMFQGKRIVLRRLLTRKFRLQASSVTETMITTDNVLNMIPRIQDADVDYALGILNSRLISWAYVNMSSIAQKDDFPQVHISALSAIGLPRSNQSRCDRMVNLVRRMLDLHRQQQAAGSEASHERLQREINVTDEQIDKLVYELYGLREEEIRSVEGR